MQQYYSPADGCTHTQRHSLSQTCALALQPHDEIILPADIAHQMHFLDNHSTPACTHDVGVGTLSGVHYLHTGRARRRPAHSGPPQRSSTPLRFLLTRGH